MTEAFLFVDGGQSRVDFVLKISVHGSEVSEDNMFRHRAISYFLLFGIVFTLISIPYLTGVIRPSYTIRHPYALFYAFFFLPFEALFREIISSVAHALWESPAPHQLNLAAFFVVLLFWSLIGMVVGLVSDLRGNRGG